MIQKHNCIYRISFVGSDLFYIGSAINFLRRKDRHLVDLRKNRHGNPILQRCFNKYGEKSLYFTILETDCEELIMKEQFYIDTLNPPINICKCARNRLGVKHTEETKNKLRKRKLSKEHIEKIRLSHLGKKQSPELIEKRIAWKRGLRKYTKICAFCGISFKTSQKSRKFHSKECYNNYQKTKPSWNKGIPCREETKEKLRLKMEGSKSPKAKFIPEEIIKIRDMRENGKPVIEIGNLFQVDRGTIYDIVNGGSYRDVR